MASIDLQGLWGNSLLGRLTASTVATWQDSRLAHAMGRAGHFVNQVFGGSFFGKVWHSAWPDSQQASNSSVGRAVAGLNRIWTRLADAVGPFLANVWDSSGLVGLGRTICQGLAPAFSTSLFGQTYAGFPSDVALAADEVNATRRTDPTLYLLGFVLGLVPLIPDNFALGPIRVPSPTTLMVAGIWGSAFFWLLRKLARRDNRWWGSSAFLPFAFLISVALVAAVQSVLRGASLTSLVIWLTAALFFWMNVNLVRTSRDAAALMGPILAGATLMGLWSLYQFVKPPVVTENWTDVETSGQIVRVFASLGNPNYLAEYMALYLPLGVAFWIQQPRRRLVLSGQILLMIIALLLTNSRGGWLAAALALGLFIMVRLPALIPLGVIAAALAPFVAPASIVRRFTSAFNMEDSSIGYRFNLYRGFFDLLRDHGLTGVGLGAPATAKVYENYALSGAMAAHAHNTYIQVTAEMGILGLIAVLWLLLVVVRRTMVVGASPRRPFLIAAVPAAIIGLLAHGMVEHIWYNPKLLFAFWAVAGLGMGLALGHREETAS